MRCCCKLRLAENAGEGVYMLERTIVELQTIEKRNNRAKQN